jgi:glucokinase
MNDIQKSKIILAGDIGGTKTNMGLFREGPMRPEPILVKEYSSGEATNLTEIIEHFLGVNPETIHAACFGVAGPVIDGKTKITNLHWGISLEEITQKFNWKRVRLINDLSATGYSLRLLDSSELRTLNSGQVRANGTVGLVAPGTGLGISLLVPGHGKLHPIPSEGGHLDFAPRNEQEVDLWRYLSRIHDHVSIERIASGPGIQSIYAWLKSTGKFREPEWLTERMKASDPSAAISEGALNEQEPICLKTLDIFVSVLGATSGNVALMGMTTGGLYLGGGIPPQILPKLEQDSIFMNAFLSKGRFREILSQIRVEVIMNARAALLGAAAHAFTL